MLGKLAYTNKIVAKNLGVGEERVSKVMGFFIGELSREIKEVNHPFIYVKDLGTFTIALAPIEGRIKRFWLHYNNARRKVDGEKETESCKTILFELFAMRRLLKNKREELKELKDARKVKNDCKGQLLPNNREE